MREYLIKINNDQYYTGLITAPCTDQVSMAKHYAEPEHATKAAIKVFSRRNFIKSVEIIKTETE